MRRSEPPAAKKPWECVYDTSYRFGSEPPPEKWKPSLWCRIFGRGFFCSVGLHPRDSIVVRGLLASQFRCMACGKDWTA